MGSGIKDKYNIAINGKGYILKGAPNRPAYLRGVVASQIERLAISDLAYSDFAGTGLFFVAQTDWYAGIKSEKKWRDDAKYWYSTNIDTYSEQGTIQLEKELQSENDFAENIICGGAFEVNNVINEYVGCEDNASGYVKIYKESSGWSDISGTDFGTSPDLCNQLIGHKNKLWALNGGSSNSFYVASYNGTAWTDEGEVATTGIRAISTLTTIESSRCGCSLVGTLYIWIDNHSNNEIALMSTANNGSTWTEELYLETAMLPDSCVAYNDKIYYILSDIPSHTAELRVFDPSDSSDASIKTFKGVNLGRTGVGDKYLVVYKGKLIITIPNNNIYEYDGSSLTEIWLRNIDKAGIAFIGSGFIYYGAVEYENRLYWDNFIYDGEAFYNCRRPNGDSDNYLLRLLYVNQNNAKRMIGSEDESILWKDATTYKTTLANNFLVFNEMSQISSIEKLLHSVTIIFDKMATGQSVKLEYSINGRDSWVTVGTRSYSATDSTTRKEWIIPGSVIFNKIWWKISLDGSATTPKVRDVIMAYKPMPDYKNRWNMRFKMSDNFKLLNNQNEQRTGNDLLGELWNQKVAKQKVLFEDIDYVECSLVSGITATGTSALVDNTSRLPRQGRIRAVSGSVAEEMTYTSATPNKLLGISRGKRGTAARAYSAAQTLKNDYDVYIEDIKSEIGFIDENKTESVAQVMLIES